MTIRRTFGAAAGIVVIGASLVATRPLDARAVGGVNTVVVSPGHGTAAAAFQVTYSITPCVSLTSLTIGFSWGAVAPGGQVLGTAATNGACRATLSAIPPVSATTHQSPVPGLYLVFGYVVLPTGTPTPGTEASATYTVDVTATPTPTATATASAPATSKPSASAPIKPAPSVPASAPAASGQPTVPPSITAGKVAVAQPLGHPGPWTLAWQIVLDNRLLALAILAALAFLIAVNLRRRRAPAPSDRRNDRAA